MEAKDTVMTGGELCILVCKEYRSATLEGKNCDGLDCEVCQLNKQAEITWDKAIREVVEFIENNALRATYIANPNKECWGISDYELAKLKEWRIKQ